ncbi:hypothetical protein Kpol_1023p76 [Vanderwaltozyma polyspora DSM 70294]|uniref:Ubiquitin-like domain-containing protein n=1 Tax=Vanderwaltozyma polyspora (strain ATCC 22028 / DSM 70294 / BCRC 21397 / CBS 2163 / NBRC 10782 / NRRL Y-8283 / UCD 57-17) TaxID=436907 RepID=A7TFU9_VANPO|nr:uncharacterized protein Kpol_1023p76 [Vanderwaltozyma polyspora DSM 70294]EDO18907.1 hypothetical protein Kpol_1023p76 [Vanderwaltozyma polyspora DSM 70294]
MECLALLPVKCTVWSSEKNLICTNILVNAHPKATVSRLLQYIHYKVFKSIDSETESSTNVGDVSEYYLLSDGKELNLSMLVHTLALNNDSGFIKLQFEKRKSHTGPAMNLDYDIDNDFVSTNISIMMNSFSIDKVTKIELKDVQWDTSLAKLEKLALNHLNYYEQNSTAKKFCSKNGAHTSCDCLGFMFKGKQRSTLLNNEAEKSLFNDLSIAEILGFDFTPSPTSYFTLMLKIKHEQDNHTLEANYNTLEFISDAHLYMHKMVFDSDTTVNDVKEFICCVYMHSLSICRSNVKLIYKGRLIKSTNDDNEPSHIVQDVGIDDKAKIHVQITTESADVEAEFYEDLFNDNMDNESSEELKDIKEDVAEDPTPTPTVPMTAIDEVELDTAELLTVENENIHQNEVQSNFPTGYGIHDRQRKTYLTESDGVVERTGKLYEKCLLDGDEEVYIECSHFDIVDSHLTINENNVELYSHEYVIGDGFIKLSPNVISRIEDRLDLDILKEDFESGDINLHDISMRRNNGRLTFFRLVEAFDISAIIRISLLLMKTLYLIIVNSFLKLCLVFQFTGFLPARIVISILVMVLLRSIWTAQDIWELWNPYIRRYRKIPQGQHEKVQNAVLKGSLPIEFYKRCGEEKRLIESLCIPELQNDRIVAYQKANLTDLSEGEDQNNMKSLFHKVSNGEAPRSLVDDVLKACLSKYNPNPSNSEEQLELQDSVKETISIIWAEMKKSREIHAQLPWYHIIAIRITNCFDLMRQPEIYRRFLKKVVPYPGRDSILQIIWKNLVLFFLVFIPPIKVMADTISAERKNEEEQRTRESESIMIEPVNIQTPAEGNMDNIVSDGDGIEENVIISDAASTLNGETVSTANDNEDVEVSGINEGEGISTGVSIHQDGNETGTTTN